MSNNNLVHEYNQLYQDRRWGIGIYIQGILLYFAIVGFLTKVVFDVVKGVSGILNRSINMMPIICAVIIYSIFMFYATKHAESTLKKVEDRLNSLSGSLGVNPLISFIILPKLGGRVLTIVFLTWLFFSIYWLFTQ